MKHLKSYNLFESFHTNYAKSEGLLELETNLTDILGELGIDGFEWVGFSSEAGSFGITSIDINIYSPESQHIQKPFRFTGVKDVISHLHSYLSDSGFRLTGVNVVANMSEESIDFRNKNNGISYSALLASFTDDGQIRYGNHESGTYSPKDIMVLKLSFQPVGKYYSKP